MHSTSVFRRALPAVVAAVGWLALQGQAQAQTEAPRPSAPASPSPSPAPSRAAAQEPSAPLPVEGLITKAGRLKLDLSLSYANAERQGVATGQRVLVQTGPTTFVSVPGSVGERRSLSDTLATSVGLRYGVSARTEVYGRISGFRSALRTSDPTAGNTSSRQSQLADVSLGVNHRFRDDKAAGPALLGFADVALYEKQQQSSARLKTASLGLTAYKSIDPVVLSFTAGYRLGLKRKDGAQELQPGALVFASPGVGISLNDRVALSLGAQWALQRPDRVDGRPQDLTRTSTDLLLGLTYGLDGGGSVSASFKLPASGNTGAVMGLSWLHEW